MRMKFKSNTQVIVTFDKDFPISTRTAGGNIFRLETAYELGIEAGEHIGTILHEAHGAFQGIYTIKFKVSEGFYALIDVPEDCCRSLKARSKKS